MASANTVATLEDYIQFGMVAIFLVIRLSPQMPQLVSSLSIITYTKEACHSNFAKLLKTNTYVYYENYLHLTQRFHTRPFLQVRCSDESHTITAISPYFSKYFQGYLIMNTMPCESSCEVTRDDVLQRRYGLTCLASYDLFDGRFECSISTALSGGPEFYQLSQTGNKILYLISYFYFISFYCLVRNSPFAHPFQWKIPKSSIKDIYFFNTK